MGKRKNDKVKKEIYQATYRDIFWEENDKMRNAIDKMWDMLSEAQKEFLKKKLEEKIN